MSGTKLILIPILVLFLIGAVFVSAEDINNNDDRVKIEFGKEGGITFIEGYFFDENGGPIKGAKVKVYCNHNGNINLISKKTTDEEGYFRTWTANIAEKRRCAEGDEAWVVIHYNKQDFESEHKEVEETIRHDPPHKGPVNYAEFDVAVPEFSTITLAVAIIGGCLGLAFLRKR